MSQAVLEAVPNVSEGRDPSVIAALADAVASVPGVALVDVSSDPDHHRSVLTYLGPPDAVLEASVAVAREAKARIDLRRHEGVHPRIGALDVLPLVPLFGIDLKEAATLARDLGRRIAEEVGIPVFLYAAASEPPGRLLADLRRGGLEAFGGGFPSDRVPDLLPPDWRTGRLHPTAGAVCVGARPPLLAWNVYLADDDLACAEEIADRIRESGGGFRGLRALAFRLPSRGRVQVSMNLERPAEVSAAEIYQEIDRLARERATRAAESEVVGLIPDEAAMSGASAFFRWSQASASRLLSRCAAEHLAARTASVHALLAALAGRGVPAAGSALAYAAAMAAALGEMCLAGWPEAKAVGAARAGFAALADRDALSCRAYLSALGPERERARRETAELRLRLAREARGLWQALERARNDLEPPMAADLEVALRLLRTVAHGGAHLARVNAAGGGPALSELERQAAEIERWADAGFGPES